MKKLRPYIKPRMEIIQVETEGVCNAISVIYNYNGGELSEERFGIIEGNPQEEGPSDKNPWATWDPETDQSPAKTWPSSKSLWED